MTNTNREPVDISGIRSWGQAVLNRAGENEPPDVEPGWWRHAAIKCAEKGLRLADEVETQGREIERYREALTKIAWLLDNDESESVPEELLTKGYVSMVKPEGYRRQEEAWELADAAVQSPTQAPLEEGEA